MGAETPEPHSVPVTSQGGPSWLRPVSCSPAQRGCPPGVRRGHCLRALPNEDCHCRTGPSGLARGARVAMESSVRHKERRELGLDLRSPNDREREVWLPCPGRRELRVVEPEGAPPCRAVCLDWGSRLGPLRWAADIVPACLCKLCERSRSPRRQGREACEEVRPRAACPFSLAASKAIRWRSRRRSACRSRSSRSLSAMPALGEEPRRRRRRRLGAPPEPRRRAIAGMHHSAAANARAGEAASLRRSLSAISGFRRGASRGPSEEPRSPSRATS